MKKIIITLMSICVYMHATTAYSIVGTYLPKRENPEQGCIVYYIHKDDEFKIENTKSLCSSTIISPKHILTAGHCEENHKDLIPYVVCPKEPRYYKITSRVIHPQYVAPANQYDIAVLGIEAGYEFQTTPITLAESSQEIKTLIEDGENCSIFGYGINNYRGSDRLYGAKLDEPGKIFAGGLIMTMGEPYSLKGDSGGGLYCKNNSNKWVMVGVISAKYQKSTITAIAVLETTLEWIMNEIETR